MKKAAIPATSYPPGYFSALVVKHNWPPMFEAQCAPPDWRNSVAAGQRAAKQRDEAYTSRTGWGSGAIPGIKGSGFERPQWMGKT